MRTLPPCRNYLLACGIERALDLVESLRFGEDDLAWLATLPGIDERLSGRLRGWRFAGVIDAVAEGTPVFAGEPIIEVTAPIADAQLLETLLMNVIGLETVLASKAARVVAAAAGRPVIDFGSRRAQGIDAALHGARAFYVAGVAATSNLLAGRRFGIPVSGTMAHSFVQACADEPEAFRRFAAVHPDTVLLVDTYDTLTGVDHVIALARTLGHDFRVRGIRLDSGDLGGLSVAARARLDAAGLHRLQIVASGGLDEHAIARLVAGGAPIDAFGVGTELSVSGDAPALDLAYKLTVYDGRGRMKLSPGKRSLPGRKQVYRQRRDGTATGDTLCLHLEAAEGGPLLRRVMQDGRRTDGRPELDALRRHAAAARAELPARLLALPAADPPYPVTVGRGLAAYDRAVGDRLRRHAGSAE